LADGPRPFATTKRGGLGLGLAMALKIIALHEGCLTLRPNRPTGLVAEVVLPRTACNQSLPLVAGGAP
jgi:signal transduction histidine kinase